MEKTTEEKLRGSVKKIIERSTLEQDRIFHYNRTFETYRSDTLLQEILSDYDIGDGFLARFEKFYDILGRGSTVREDHTPKDLVSLTEKLGEIDVSNANLSSENVANIYRIKKEDFQSFINLAMRGRLLVLPIGLSAAGLIYGIVKKNPLIITSCAIPTITGLGCFGKLIKDFVKGACGGNKIIKNPDYLALADILKTSREIDTYIVKNLGFGKDQNDK